VTRIPFTLDRATRAVLRVYNVHGALVATLLAEQLGEGRHEISWDGRDNTGQTVSSGIYIYALTANKKTVSRKMTLLK
jgi:flagellar hook assembly protein FlgD